MTLSLADLAAEPDEYVDVDELPTWDELLDLRRYLEIGLADLLSDWNAEHGPLRITKGRIRTTAICPAQVLSEVDPFAINFNIAVGIVCDAAAGVLALHPTFPSLNGWYHDLEASLRQEHPHLIEFVDGLSPTDRIDYDHVVDDLCGSLPELLGDLRTHRPTVHHRIAAAPVPGVLLTGEVDIGVDAVGTNWSGRILAEVKSGGFNPRISDELAHYGLITSLAKLPTPQLGFRLGKGGDESSGAHPGSDIAIEPTPRPDMSLLPERPAAITGCSISLGDLGVTPVFLSVEILETAARRVLETTAGLVEINQTMRDGGTPPTNPGNHCRWCRRVAVCADAPDLVLAELNETLRPLETDNFDPDFDDSPFDGPNFDGQNFEGQNFDSQEKAGS